MAAISGREPLEGVYDRAEESEIRQALRPRCSAPVLPDEKFNKQRFKEK
jgi:hypothetical protein